MWIEITASTGVYNSLKVTPLAGVWIEIRRPWAASATWRTVTPLAGVWIEMLLASSINTMVTGHSPCGSVD